VPLSAVTSLSADQFVVPDPSLGLQLGLAVSTPTGFRNDRTAFESPSGTTVVDIDIAAVGTLFAAPPQGTTELDAAPGWTATPTLGGYQRVVGNDVVHVVIRSSGPSVDAEVLNHLQVVERSTLSHRVLDALPVDASQPVVLHFAAVAGVNALTAETDGTHYCLYPVTFTTGPALPAAGSCGAHLGPTDVLVAAAGLAPEHGTVGLLTGLARTDVTSIDVTYLDGSTATVQPLDESGMFSVKFWALPVPDTSPTGTPTVRSLVARDADGNILATVTPTTSATSTP
jgi:hypothetical protein